MGLFGEVGKASVSGPKAQYMNQKGGDFYFRVDETKTYVGDNGTRCIVEGTVIKSLTDDPTCWKEGDRLTDISQKVSKETAKMFAQFVKSYVAAAFGIDPDHKFSEDEAEDSKEWEQKAERMFGKKVHNEEKQAYEYVSDNPFEGMILRIKIQEDNQSRKEEDKKLRDAQGNVRIFFNPRVYGSVDKKDIVDLLGEDVVEKYKKTFHPAYELGE